MNKNNDFIKYSSITSIHNLFNRKNNWFIIGIGGCGMSVIARLLNKFGENVFGSDIRQSNLIDNLKNENIIVYDKHDKNNISNKNVVIISSAIKKNNIEIIEAVKNKIPIFHRTHILNYFVELHKNSIGIAGSHGKGTITAGIINSLTNSNYAIGGI